MALFACARDTDTAKAAEGAKAPEDHEDLGTFGVSIYVPSSSWSVLIMICSSALPAFCWPFIMIGC